MIWVELTNGTTQLYLFDPWNFPINWFII